jgi:hypothetical protein
MIDSQLTRGVRGKRNLGGGAVRQIPLSRTYLHLTYNEATS